MSSPDCSFGALCCLRAMGLEVLLDSRQFRLRGLSGISDEERRDALCWAALYRDDILHWLRREAMSDRERAAADAAAAREFWPLERRYTVPCQMADVLAAHGLQAVMHGEDFIIANAADIPTAELGAVMEFTRRNGHLINQWLRAAADAVAKGENDD